ncbi:MAG: flippase [Pleomorphochaeta sp.]
MNSIKKNFAYNFIYQILIMLLPLITVPYLSRILGAEGIGKYSYTYSIAYYFTIFAMLGLNNYGNRSVARIKYDKEELSKTFWEIYGMQIITSIIVCICYVIYMEISNIDRIILITQGAIVISSIFNINWFFFGIEEFKLTVSRNAIIKVLTVIIIFLFVKTKNDLNKYILIMAISILLSQIVLWPFLFKRIYYVKPKMRNICKHFSQNLLLFIPVLAVSIYKIMDKIMIGNMSSMVQVGLYENSEKIITLPMSLITALGTVMLPRMSNLIAMGKKKESYYLIEKSMLFIMVMGSAFMFGIAGISNVIAPVFFGQEFINCGILITLLSITIIFTCWANVIRTQYLIPNNEDKIYVTTVSLGAIVNFIINYLLIPNFGSIGAAIGTIIAEATVCIGQTFFVRKKINIKQYLKNGFPFILIGLVMYLAVKFLGLGHAFTINILLLQIIVGTIIYIVLSLIYSRLTKNMLIKEIIKSIL